MSLATFAYIVSALEFLAGISLLVAPAKTAEWFRKFKDDDVTLRVVGAFFFVISFLVLTRGMSIGVDVAGLVRLTVWIGAVKSLLMCWWPKWVMGRVDWAFSRPAATRLFSLIALAVGVLFLLAGNYLRGAGT
jgi:hypothetical protein